MCVHLCVCMHVCMCVYVWAWFYYKMCSSHIAIYSYTHTNRYVYVTLYSFSSQYFRLQDDKNKHINIITHFLNLFLMKVQVLQQLETLLLTLPCLVPVLCYQDSHPLQLALKWVFLLWFALFWVVLVWFVLFPFCQFYFVLYCFILPVRVFFFYSLSWMVQTNFLL